MQSIAQPLGGSGRSLQAHSSAGSLTHAGLPQASPDSHTSAFNPLTNPSSLPDNLWAACGYPLAGARQNNV